MPSFRSLFALRFLEMASSVKDILNSGPVPLARVRDYARRTLVALLDAVRRFRGGREREEEEEEGDTAEFLLALDRPSVSTFFPPLFRN